MLNIAHTPLDSFGRIPSYIESFESIQSTNVPTDGLQALIRISADRF